MEFNKTYADCYVQLENNILKIGNDALERTWNLQGDIPVVLSLLNKKTRKEWFGECEETCWSPGNISKYAFMKQQVVAGHKLKLSVSADIDNDLGIAVTHMKVNVTIEYDKVILTWVHTIYPEIPLHRSHICCHLKEGNSINSQMLDGSLTGETIIDDFVDYFPLEQKHYKWKTVNFVDKTDDFNNLVKGDEGLFCSNEAVSLNGNLCFVNELISDEGFIIIKEGPTQHSYQGGMKNDFNIESKNIFVRGWGIFNDELNSYRELSTYGSSVILWNGCEEQALIALQVYHNALHKFVPAKDSFVMSNTWGDRSQDKCICEEFILKELKLAARLGVSIYQIDDGWQRGVTANSIIAGGIWTGYHAKDADFWEVNAVRFPRGLEPIANCANELGINLGLWFSPDSSNNFENWEKDTNVIVSLHKKYGIKSFKLDGIKIASKKGEENLTKMMQNVIKNTEGNVFLNLDTTAETRSGYYGRVQYGNLFLENRYTESKTYYPHWTLRNLWMLSKYYPTYRLQIEFLNVMRNRYLYEGDVLSPSSCGIEYSFAVTMFANPLCWMELTGLDEDSVQILSPVMKEYRKHQADILSGIVLPIGEEPSGAGWTGFQSITDKTSGFLLIIKELNNADLHNYKLWSIKGKTLRLKKLIGCGTQEIAEVNDEGRAEFKLEGIFKYGLYHYEEI